MFVRDFIHVERPFEAVAPRFVASPAWLHPLASSAVAEAVELSHRMTAPASDAASPDPRADPPVRCELGHVRLRADALVVPVRWRVDCAINAFTSLAGDLEVAPIGHERSQLTLSATYPRPDPDSLDPAVLQRSAEAAVRHFLRLVAERIEAGTPT